MGKTITGTTTLGLTLTTSPITIDGTISSDTTAAVYGSAAKDWKITNKGLLSSGLGSGIDLAGGGNITNAAHATIAGYEGIVTRAATTISNAGTITSTSPYGIGIVLFGGGAVSNVTGGGGSSKTDCAITNSAGGVISGAVAIESAYGVTLNLLNKGVIASTAIGFIAMIASGTITNAKGGTIVGGTAIVLDGGTIINAGRIEATSPTGAAIEFEGSADNEIIQQSGGTLFGTIKGFISGDTIDEAGLTITSESFANGTLTLFDGTATIGNLTLTGDLNTTAFSLKSDGHGGTDILLGAETFAGTYTNTVELVALSNTIAASARITSLSEALYGNAYRDWTLVNHGTIIGGSQSEGVLFYGAGQITDTGLIEGATGIKINGGTIIDSGTISGTGGVAIDLIDSTNDSEIVLKSAGTLLGAISGFETGDTIDLAGITTTKESFRDGVLTLTNGKTVVQTIDLAGLFNTGGFTIKSDGAGGTDITTAPTETFSAHYGVELDLSSLFTTITSTGSFGVYNAIYGAIGRNWTLVNAGTIAASLNGVIMNAGTITNTAGGIITGRDGISAENASIVNAGTISGAGAYSYGVSLFEGRITNLKSGTISGGGGGGVQGDGIEAFSATVTNDGLISGPTGIYFSGGAVSNYGRIIAGGGNAYRTYLDTGLVIRAGYASNSTAGTIAGSTGVRISGGTLINTGLIEGLPGGYRRGIYGGLATVASIGISISSIAAVTNLATGTISGAYGVVLNGGTLTDAGTIASTLSAGAAIAFGTADSTLILDQGNVIIGDIAGFLSGDVIDFAATTITSEKFSNGVITLLNGTAIVEKLSLTGFLNQKDFTLATVGTGTELIIGQEILTGSYSSGITLTAPTTIAKTATIAAAGTALYGSAARDWTLLNQGLVTATLATYDQAVILKSASLITNAASGLIEGAFVGLNAGGYTGHATLINAGTILATGAGVNATAIYLAGESTMTNTGLIAGRTGLSIGAGSTIINAGTIASTTTAGTAIKLAGLGTTDITLDAGSKIIGAIAGFAGADIIDFANQTLTTDSFSNGTLTLFDAGISITSLIFNGGQNQSEFTLASDGANGTKLFLGPEILTGTYQYGITLTANRTTIAATALVEVLSGHAGTNTSGYALVDLARNNDTITNDGRIIDTYYGKSGAFVAGDTFINAAGATLSGSAGIKLEGQGGAVASLTNAGTIIGIRAGGYGLDLTYGFLTNGKSGLVTGGSGMFIYDAIATNNGLIQGTSYKGIDVFGGTGNITNQAQGTITGATGISLYDTGTVTNAGTIQGTAGTAIEFGFGASRFIDDPGATLIGGVTATGTAAHVLELAKGGAASLAGIGETILGFTTITFDSGAAFTLKGDTAGLAAGQTIENVTSTDTIILDNFSASSFSTIAHGLVLKNSSGTITLDISTTLAGAFSIHASGTTTTITAAPSGAVITTGALATAPMTFLHPATWVTLPATLPPPPAAPATQTPARAIPAPTVSGWLHLHQSPQPPPIPAVTLHPA